MQDETDGGIKCGTERIGRYGIKCGTERYKMRNGTDIGKNPNKRITKCEILHDGRLLCNLLPEARASFHPAMLL